jgi:sec-independent protein translocase protein TatA
MFPSHWEILVIFLVVLLLFGAKRIPEMAKGMGKGIREFRSAVKDVQEEVDIAGRNDSRPNIPPASTAPPAAPPGPVARTESVPAPAAESSGAESTQKETHS